MMSEDAFPSRLALGEQFCNRKQEREFLTGNIYQCRHTVLVAPRRYGKSSLVANVVQALQLPSASVDLFLAHDDRTVTKRILLGISQAVSQMMPINQKILEKIQAIFGKFRVSLGAQGFFIEISATSESFDPVDQIFSGLQALDNLAKSQEKKLVFFIDEFQDMAVAESAKSIQGAIRHVAQATTHITFIFSGSHQRVLRELFDDRSKPLYMLCDMMPLERIASPDYLPHLQKLAEKKWHRSLPEAVFERVMVLTELHPYYVNLLCHVLWKKTQLPGIDDVLEAWETCYQAHRDRLIAELEKLSLKQQDFLKVLAAHPTSEPMGHRFVSIAKHPSSTISQMIKGLFEKDMIYKITKLDTALPQLSLNQIRVLDPLLSYALKKYS